MSILSRDCASTGRPSLSSELFLAPGIGSDVGSTNLTDRQVAGWQISQQINMNRHYRSSTPRSNTSPKPLRNACQSMIQVPEGEKNPKSCNNSTSYKGSDGRNTSNQQQQNKTTVTITATATAAVTVSVSANVAVSGTIARIPIATATLKKDNDDDNSEKHG